MPRITAFDPEFHPTDACPPKAGRASIRTRGFILLGLLGAFMTLTFLAVRSGSPGDLRDRPVVLTTLATITGPFTGAIARHGQRCCLQASASLAAICGPILAMGLASQIIPLPLGTWRQPVQIALWTLGWFAWFSGGILSFAHAFS